MASTKIKFRASIVSGKQGTLFIQVIHQRVVRQLRTSYKLYPDEWDATRQSVALPSDTSSHRIRYLEAVQEALQHDTSRLQLILLALDHSCTTYCTEEVIQRFLKQEQSDEFMTFATALVSRKREEGHGSLAAKYQTSLRSFSRFLDGRPLPFDDLNAELMLRYEASLKQQGLCPNTTSFYLRNLRAIYNRAVEQGLTSQRHPFAHVYTGTDKTIKRAVTLQEVQRIKSYLLPPDTFASFSRDLFLFSLYTCGMSLIDIAHLKQSNLRDGYLTYYRQKTGQVIQIRWEPCMQELVDRYRRADSPYLFPIITRPGQDEARQYHNQLHLINHHLKQLGETLHLSTKLTTYVARHSWASIAQSQDVPIAAISGALGHTTERTTRIYLKSFDNRLVDSANEKVLSAIL